MTIKSNEDTGLFNDEIFYAGHLVGETTGATSGTYAGWDRFGRTRQQYWTGYSGTANVDRIYYDYDYASNRLYSDIDSVIYASNNRDQVYSYDSAHRLKTFDQGTLSGTTISGTPTQEQDWSLDGLGNWSNYVTKTSGTTALNQDRTVNKVNEITDITESVGPAWVTPGYDAAGSMTTIPRPNNLTSSYTATYDAWHRLVKLAIGGTTVAEYEYDATKQRIVKAIYVGGVLDDKHHFYYNDNWQVLETLVADLGSPGHPQNPDPLAQYVWHPYYIDALILRDYDIDTNETPVRYYYIQDVNFNVLSILSSSGTVLERYGYTPYGQAELLTASFTAYPGNETHSDNDITFTGQRYDSESRLMLYRHRYYHPVLGTFCSRDPVSYQGSEWNLYEYVKASPATYLDPEGLDILSRAVPEIRNAWDELTRCCDKFCTRIETFCDEFCTKVEPFSIPRNEPDCCKAAETQRNGSNGTVRGGSIAGVICCDGRLVVCLWEKAVTPNKKATDIINDCIVAHENLHKHKHEKKCERWPHIYRNKYPDDKKRQFECEAYSAQRECLINSKDNCQGDPECGSEVEQEIERVERLVTKYCN